MFPFGQRFAPPSPLPFPVPPFTGETTQSYLYRLAVANQLHPDDLRAHLTGTRQHAPIAVDSLAAATGRAPQALLHALPEMRQPTQPGVDPKIPGHARRTVCRHCAARRDAFPFAVTWLPTEVNVCPHHMIWLGRSVRGHSAAQYYIGGLPEIRQAEKRHHHLARRRGRQAAASAFAEAVHITFLWSRHGLYRDRRAPLIHAFIGHNLLTGKLPTHNPITPIVTYPETVDLARLLAMPRWRQAPGRATKRELRQFKREVDHRLGIRYQPGNSRYDALLRWFNTHHALWP